MRAPALVISAVMFLIAPPRGLGADSPPNPGPLLSPKSLELATDPDRGPLPQSRAGRQISQCCKVCRKGKACGNSCISRTKTCHKPPGCACDAN
jgi:hypothetical protein